MVNNPQRIEITDPETGEIVSINPATAVSNLRDLFVSRRRLQVVATPWPNLTEDQQRDEINRATEWSEEVIREVVEMVAQAGRQVIHAKLDNFKVKDGEVTITGKGRADDGALLSLNHVGTKFLKIVVADAEQFDQQRDDMEPTPDQADLLPDHTEPENSKMTDAEIADAFKAMDTDVGIEDADDSLHDEPKSPSDMGYEARINGDEPDAPFDGGTDEHTAWKDGYDRAQRDMDGVDQEGYDARMNGYSPDKCDWKKGSSEAELWLIGYNRAKAEQDKEDAQAAESEDA